MIFIICDLTFGKEKIEKDGIIKCFFGALDHFVNLALHQPTKIQPSKLVSTIEIESKMFDDDLYVFRGLTKCRVDEAAWRLFFTLLQNNNFC
jgi:hypothetical protein